MVKQQRIVIVGGGIAGVEAALTMARGLPDATVTLVSEREVLDVIPNLVFVPFGVNTVPSTVAITGVTFDYATHRREAVGSDNFPATWSNDDHQYAVWGDGGGFGEGFGVCGVGDAESA